MNIFMQKIELSNEKNNNTILNIKMIKFRNKI